MSNIHLSAGPLPKQKEVCFHCFIHLLPLLCRKLMSAPNVLRIGRTENIFVECQDCTDSNDLSIEITVMKYPTKSEILASTSVNLTRTNKFQNFGQIMVNQ